MELIGGFSDISCFAPSKKKGGIPASKIICFSKLVLCCCILHTVFVPVFVIWILPLIRQCIVLAQPRANVIAYFLRAVKVQMVASILRIGRPVDAKRIMGVMSLGVKCGDTVKLTIEGEDEETAAAAMQAFLESNL